MRPCAICVQPPSAVADSVSCSGPCGQLFHASCVALDRWPPDNPGLLWFCEDCRLEFNPAVRKRESAMAEVIRGLSERIDAVDASVRTLAATLGPAVLQEPEDADMVEVEDRRELPAEVLEKVFAGLSYSQLLQVRVVCKRWKQVIDESSVLMERLTLQIPNGTTIDREFAPESVVPARRVRFCHARIVSVGFWWVSGLGQNLVELCLASCTFSLTILVDLLRKTPNLKCFDLHDSYFSVDRLPSVDFRLERLEELKVKSKHSEILDMFGQMLPRLKSFKIAKPYDEQKVLDFVRVVQDSLETIDISPTEDILPKIAGLERLRLKRIWFGLEAALKDYDHRQLVEVSRLQPAIEDLDVRTVFSTKRSYVKTLRELTVTLPRLKRLSFFVLVDLPLSFSFLTAFRDLEHLELTGRWQIIEFFKERTPNLRELTLHHIHPVEEGLEQLLKACPNLRQLELKSIGRLTNWSDIFGPIQQLKSLQQLSLEHVTVQNKDDCLSEYLDSLKYLRLVNCDLSKQMLLTLINLCPRLEEVHLQRRDKLDDEEVLAICQKLKFLQKLTLSHLTHTSAEYIVAHCHALERLDVLEWHTQPAGARTRLQNVRTLRVQRC